MRHPKLSETPLAAEQLAVYRAVLSGWLKSEKFAVNLSMQTVPADPADSTCAKNLSFEEADNSVHRFRQEDLALLGLENVHLVDPDAQAEVVHQNDPDNGLRNGDSVDHAVEKGFAHGLFTLGALRFDRDRTHALVSFRFWCGSLCGNGSTILMEKKNGAWKLQKRCGGWVA